MMEDSDDDSVVNEIKKRIKVSNDEIDLAVALHVAKVNQVICGLVVGQQAAMKKKDHGKLPRTVRVAKNHMRALVSSKEEYTGPTPIFRGREFETHGAEEQRPSLTATRLLDDFHSDLTSSEDDDDDDDDDLCYQGHGSVEDVGKVPLGNSGNNKSGQPGSQCHLTGTSMACSDSKKLPLATDRSRNQSQESALHSQGPSTKNGDVAA
jgi:hypothetical protein